MKYPYGPIEEAEKNNDENQLNQIFQSITTDDLNSIIDLDSHSNLVMALLNLFDKENKYPNFLIDLFNSPNMDPNRLNINCQCTFNGMTLLMYAAYRGRLEILQKLLSWGADTTTISYYNASALYYACIKGEVKIFKILAPLATDEHFDIKKNHNNRTIRDEVVARLSESKNYHEIRDAIDQEREKRGLVDLK